MHLQQAVPTVVVRSIKDICNDMLIDTRVLFSYQNTYVLLLCVTCQYLLMLCDLFIVWFCVLQQKVKQIIDLTCTSKCGSSSVIHDNKCDTCMIPASGLFRTQGQPQSFMFGSFFQYQPIKCFVIILAPRIFSLFLIQEFPFIMNMIIVNSVFPK